MQSNSTPFSPIPFLFNGDLSSDGGGFEGTRVLLFASLLFSQGVGVGVGVGGSGSGMDLSKVGEKILSSVRSARSLGLLPSTSDRPEVPARAVAAAAVARALAGIPPHKRQSLASSSAELSSIYGSAPHGKAEDELEEDFYEEEFDPVGFVLEHIPSDDSDAGYFEEKANLRLSQLDKITERLSHHVMEHHEEMVKGMQLVRELEKDLKVANVICMNGRRHLTSSMNEVSRDLVVPTSSKKKQFLLDMLPILAELLHAMDMQVTLESHVDKGNFFKAFQVLSEYLQILDSLSELSAIKEMSRGVEVWLGKTLQKLDSLLLGVCQDFKEEGYITVVDAYAIIGDVSGLAEKIQSYFMQEVLSETHSVLRNILLEDLENSNPQTSRLTYSDLCHHIPESKFRQCLLTTLSVLFNSMSSYYAIMSFRPEDKLSAGLTEDVRPKQVFSENGCSSSPNAHDLPLSECLDTARTLSSANLATETSGLACVRSNELIDESRDGGCEASSSGSPWFQLRKDATDFVSLTLQRGCKNLWQLTASRLSVLLSSSAVCSSSIHQFLKNYEDLNIFILAGEAFCGAEAVEFRQKLKAVCENYFVAFHRQNIHALKMVLEKENWLKLPPETIQCVSFAGLLGDGAALFVPSDHNSSNSRMLRTNKPADSVKVSVMKFSDWLGSGNPFMVKLNSKECYDSLAVNVVESGDPDAKLVDSPSNTLSQNNDANHVNGNSSFSEEENEDLHADFIDEDSQLPSRIYKPKHRKNSLSHFNDEEMTAQTGSSLCLLRLIDKYARLMQKLEIVNVEFFKGICQLFGIFFHFVFETFGHQSDPPSGKGSADALSYRLKSTLSRISQDCDQWIKPQSITFSSSSPVSTNALAHVDVTPTSPHCMSFNYPPGTSFGLKERCAAADTLSLVARVLHRSKAHLQSALVQNNAAVVEDFYSNLVESATDLTQHIHRTTARILLHINGYVDRIANAKWEVKELGLEHNGYVDLLLGEFKHYKTRLSHGGLKKEVQDLLLDYGVDIVAETLVEGLSRVRRCSDEGRVLMSLDLQVLINGLQHFVPEKVKPKLQTVETFIKAYYLPETEFVHWARAHPEYSKSQIIGLITLVATVKGWKRKTRLEVLEKIEGA